MKIVKQGGKLLSLGGRLLIMYGSRNDSSSGGGSAADQCMHYVEDGETVLFKVDDETWAVSIVKSNDTVPAPSKTPVKEGHSFIGWYDVRNNKISFPYNPSGDNALYARFISAIKRVVEYVKIESITIPSTMEGYDLSDETRMTINKIGGNIETDTTLTCRAGVKGKTYKYNQLVQTSIPSSTMSGITFTNNNDGSWTISGSTNSTDGAYNQFTASTTRNHKYFVNLIGGTDNIFIWLLGYSGGLQNKKIISEDTTNPFGFYVGTNATFNNLKVYPMVIDLTEIYGAGNEPTTVSQFLEDYPMFNSYVPYTTGTLVSPRIGNEWDEEWELGDLHYANGTTISNPNGIRSKNFIPVTPSTDYHKYCGGSATCVYWYDKDKNFIERDTNGNSDNIVVTSPSNAYYMKFSTYSNAYGSTYNHDIAIYQETPSIEYVGSNLASIGNVEGYNYSYYSSFVESKATLLRKGTYSISLDKRFYLRLFDKNKQPMLTTEYSYENGTSTWDNNALDVTSSVSITLSKDAYAVICCNQPSDTSSHLMINAGSTSKAYSPYLSQSVKIPATTLNGTDEIFSYVEGNQLVTKKVTRYGEVDLSTLTWQYQNDFYAMVAEMKAGTNISGYCDKYATTIERYTEKSVLLGLGNNYIFITDSSLSSTDKPSGKLVYELATPTVTEISRVTLTCDFEKVENVISAELAKQNVEKGVVKATMCDKVETESQNLFDKDSTDNIPNKIVNDSGKEVANNDYILSHYINVEGLNYIYFRKNTDWSNFYDKDKNFISFFVSSTSGVAVPSNAHYIRVTVAKTDLETYGVYRTQTSAYTPYFKHSYLSTQLSQIKTRLATNDTDITLGHIDFEKRKFVVEKAKVDLGELNCNLNTGGDFTLDGVTLKYSGSTTTKSNIVCSIYETNTLVELTNGTKGISVLGNGNLWIKDNNYTNATLFKSAVKGLYLTYELATPYEIDLSDILTDDAPSFLKSECNDIYFLNENDEMTPINATITYDIPV